MANKSNGKVKAMFGTSGIVIAVLIVVDLLFFGAFMGTWGFAVTGAIVLAVGWAAYTVGHELTRVSRSPPQERPYDGE